MEHQQPDQDEVLAASRKARRKRERAQAKEQRRRHGEKFKATNDDNAAQRKPEQQPASKKQRTSSATSAKGGSKSKQHQPRDASKQNKTSAKKTSEAKKKEKKIDKDPYAGLSPDVAAALRREDAEIADLEGKLGLTTGEKEKKRLNKEYAKLEGYGDDFGDFLQGLDNIIVGGRGTSGRASGGGKKGYPPLSDEDYDNDDDDLFGDDNERGEDDYDDEENNGNHGSDMHRFFNDPNDSASEREDDEDDDDDDDEEEEEIPMKDAPIMDDDDSVMEELEKAEEDTKLRHQKQQQQQKEKSHIVGKSGDEDEESNSEEDKEEKYEEEKEEEKEKEDDDDGDDDDENDSDEDIKDHNAKDTYRPSKGQDIYGNTIDSSASGKDQNSAYVPPHLRNKQKNDNNNDAIATATTTSNDQARQESLKAIQRALNNALNRLSQDTLIPVTQSIAQLYDSNSSNSKKKKNMQNNNAGDADCHHATSDVNGGIWNHTRNACVTGRTIVMTGLIPVYLAALAGVVSLHPQAQLAEYVLELNVVQLWKILDSQRQAKATAATKGTASVKDDAITKEASNLCLILCYLYNFGMVHCSLLYDVIRNLIESFKEIDVELLLLILSHCGRALRTDDPLALKEIVLLVVQKQVNAASNKGKDQFYSSRVDYMVSAINDLKNNKRRKQDTAIAENTAKLRKIVGQIKSKAAAGGSSSSSSGDSSLRITLNDIFNAETKGRWWKVGASWVGNQYHFENDQSKAASNGKSDTGRGKDKDSSVSTIDNETPHDKTLLKLAAKYRMNTDIRRSIFCIIMGSADCDDAFEKLVRGGMLKNKTERDTVRVLMECCANEKAFNKFYAHLANRICEYQMQCKFTFQLAFWDIFKQFDSNDDNGSGRGQVNAARKAANMAKLLFHLVAEHGALKLNILKAIDMASHEELPENGLIFLTIFFTNLLEYYDDPELVSQLFQSAIKNAQHGSSKKKAAADHDDDDDDDMEHFADESEALGGSFSLFFVQVLKASPKYKKGSKFRANLKAAIKACDTDNFF